MEKIEHPFAQKSTFSGVLDKNLKSLEKRLGISLSTRGDALLIDGPEKNMKFAKDYFEKIKDLEEKGYSLSKEDLHITLDLFEEGMTHRIEDFLSSEPLNLSRKSVTPKSLNQQQYIQAIKEYDLVFGIGPAGTGRSYLAMAMALSFLQDKAVNRIALIRPAIEAGEKLGFLTRDI